MPKLEEVLDRRRARAKMPEHRRGQDLDDAGAVDDPHEERQPEPVEALGAQRVDGHDEVDPGHDRGEPDDEHAERESE